MLLLVTFALSIPTAFLTGMTVTIPTVCARSGGLVRFIDRVCGHKEYTTTSKEHITFLIRNCGINTKVYYG